MAPAEIKSNSLSFSQQVVRRESRRWRLRVCRFPDSEGTLFTLYLEERQQCRLETVLRQ